MSNIKCAPVVHAGESHERESQESQKSRVFSGPCSGHGPHLAAEAQEGGVGTQRHNLLTPWLPHTQQDIALGPHPAKELGV